MSDETKTNDLDEQVDDTTDTADTENTATEDAAADTADTTNTTDETAQTESTEDEDDVQEHVAFSVVFDDDPVLPEDVLDAQQEEDDADADDAADAADSSVPVEDDASDASDEPDETVQGETDATDSTQPAVPQETSAEATAKNARRVDETIALAAGALADKRPADPNETPDRHAADRAESARDVHAAAASTHARLGRQVDDRVLLKSYPTFSLNHATTTNRKSGRHVLDNVSMAFYAGSLYAVRVLDDADDPEQRVTLMEVFGGFLTPTSGAAMTKSLNLAELEINELRGHRLGLVPQRYAVRGDLDAESNVLYAMNASGRTYLKPKPIAAREFLARTGFGEATSGKKVKDLPAVDQRRVAIARAISCEAETLILDEPTKGLDEKDAQAILSLLRTIAHGRDPKRAVIVVTADADVAAAADKVYQLED